MSNSTPIGNCVVEVDCWAPERSSENGFFRYIDLSALDKSKKTIDTASVVEIEFRAAPSRARQLVKAGDVLVSTVRPNLNGVALIGNDLDGATASTGYCILRCNGNLNPEYLFFWVQTPAFVDEMTRRATGANYPAVTDRIVKTSKIPLPPLGVQCHIAKTLKQADRLRRQAQQIEAELDRLAQALFRDMFGDYRQQAAKSFVPLAEVADVVSGVAKGSKLTGAVRSLPYLRVANVQDGFLDLSEIKEIEATERDIEKYRLKAGDILMTEGGDFDKLGRGAMWSGEITECIHQNHIFRVRLSDAYEPRFFECYLRTPMVKTYFLGCAKKTTNLASINMSQLKALPTPKESLGRQKQFVVALQKIEAQRQMARRQQVELEQGFQSLMQRAFKGELTPKLA
ncbi:restriction endonuclease subunit S [Pseudomonas sp. SC11]|uniref:restriction endonuclease subunit S n=1 Tax=Pseudomonas sp. SC11 TaxID=326927 RepID=UPI00399B717C